MAQADAFLEELVRISGDLDRLIADRTAGPTSHTRSERHIDQAETLAAQLLRAGRGLGRPVNPPLGRTPGGGYIW